MRPALSLLAAGILGAALLTGCSATAPESGTVSGDTGSQPNPTSNSSSVDGTPARVVSVDTGTVFAAQEYTIPGTTDKVTFGVQSLVVDGQTMTLKMVLTPDFTSVSDSEAVSVYDMTGTSTFIPTLIDRENLKEYSLLKESVNTWATDRVYTKTTNHEPVIWWGVYAAPEDGNETFDLRVLDAMAEFTDVPVQR